ncbi:MAG: flagellar protein FlgN [Desulfobacterales bacterium]|nr:flagellar protein FlgN [Desulfobacterales bacterium]
MQTAIQTLEALFYEKILLYQELVACLKRERDALIKTDMDVLWEIADEKQSIVSRIATVREKILAALSEASIDHGMNVSSFSLADVLALIPQGHRARRFKKTYLSLVALKDEIHQRSRENRLFIEESLDFLDELIGVIVGAADKPKPVYNNGRSLTCGKRHANLLLHKEV